MTAVLTLDWPDYLSAALKAAGYTPERLSEEAMASLAADLFPRRVLSLGQAACLAKMSHWDFIPFLGQRGIAVADYDDEEIAKELEAGRWLSKNPTK
jgi:predicted HTH domain antitoxin